MQRSICRLIRGTCRKFRENDCPTVGSEEVRQKRKSKEDFTPPKYSISEALGWTTGLILTYEFTHRHRRNCFGGDVPSGTARERLMLYIRHCPFAIAKEVSAQPTFTTVSTVKNVRSSHQKNLISIISKKSIDTTPFLNDPAKFFPEDAYGPTTPVTFNDDNDEEDGVYFDPTISKFDEVRAHKPHDPKVAASAEKVASDILSALGAFMLAASKSESSLPPKAKDMPSLDPFYVLERGAELGSSRALYNLGVAYERKNETELANEYFKRAAALGHPLACYNVAVENIAEGNLQDGWALMAFAAQNGVQEAVEVLNDRV